MILIVIVLILAAGYFYIKWNYSYWKRRGLEQIEPVFLYGNVKDIIFGKLSLGDQFKNFYDEFKSKNLKHGGVYVNLLPSYVPTDLEIIKCIMQKDFTHFVNHDNYINEKADPLSAHLFALKDDRWKKLRVKLTPTFTSGKMKMMFPTMVACTEGLRDILNESANLQDPVDIKEVLARFTTDIIGSAGFGIDCNSLKNPESEFRLFGRRVFESSTQSVLKRMISTTLPKGFLNKVGFKRRDSATIDFFMNVVKNTVDYREKNNLYRKDFMHLLLQLKNRGKLTDDERIIVDEDKNNENGHYLTINEVAAQCFVFFAAGFETSSTASTFALLELAKNPEIQKKLRDEIKTVLKKHNNQITYEAIMEMNYLDNVVNETLRRHPPLPVTTRVCNKTYKVPDTDIVIEKGMIVNIPISGIQMDPENYPDPEIFDPNRFSEENEAKRRPFAFLPFGEGPRMCIGARFGVLQTKVGLVAIIGNFEVTLSDKTKFPIKYKARSIITSIDGDLWLNFHTVK